MERGIAPCNLYAEDERDWTIRSSLSLLKNSCLVLVQGIAKSMIRGEVIFKDKRCESSGRSFFTVVKG